KPAGTLQMLAGRFHFLYYYTKEKMLCTVEYAKNWRSVKKGKESFVFSLRYGKIHLLYRAI
uniref:hypothetical protein n=1 Tax=Sporofaciens musculi TaxID=2681861 RepID=UPI0025A1B180